MKLVKILFVCTGNTCRSPMAEVMAASILGEGFHVSSCGVGAFGGQPASTNATLSMAKRNLDLTKHKSRYASDKYIKEADLILTMTNSHKNVIYQKAKNKIYTLSEYADGNPIIDIIDPFGGSLKVYDACAEEIYEFLLKVKDKILNNDILDIHGA